MPNGSGHCLLLDSPQLASRWLAEQQNPNHTVGFVPTMGALHDGHLSLIRAARECDLVCASIFVNPLQFNNPDDLVRYPRNMEKDLELLKWAGCNMVFTGTLEYFFPGSASSTDIPLQDPGIHARGLEGEHRPGHFAGVRTIVRRLFETVGQCRAYFGEKDFQQSLVITDLAGEMGYPVIIVCPTRREPHGLAMSSRNELLTADERSLAGRIYQALLAASTAWHKGEHCAAKIERVMHNTLAHPRIMVEYAVLRDPEHWDAGNLAGNLERAPRALIAVRIGQVRLIDNLDLGCSQAVVSV